MGPAPAWFTGLANFCPAECVAFWNAAKSGDGAKAFEACQRLFELSGDRRALRHHPRGAFGPRAHRARSRRTAPALAKLGDDAKAELAQAIRAGIA